MTIQKNNVKIPTLWLHMGTKELKKESFKEIKNIPIFNKPRGGLWTSPYEQRGEYLSDWHEQSLQMGFEAPKYGVLFTLKKDARICVIDSQYDLIRVIEQFPATPPVELHFMRDKHIDFEKIKNEYDVIYLTEEGQWDTRLPTINYEYNLYGWDCASAIILNFDVINKQKKVKIK